MKGIVFTEFLDLVEIRYGLEIVDKIIHKSKLDSQGIYTSIGTYSFSEMLQLLENLRDHNGISIDNLLLIYGELFFSVIETIYMDILSTYKDLIEMLSSIKYHIHVEVRKIYQVSELPTFHVVEKTNNSLIMIYKSSRSMHHFGLVLMNKTFEYFNSKASILLEKIKEDGTEVRFIIEKIDNESR